MIKPDAGHRERAGGRTPSGLQPSVLSLRPSVLRMEPYAPADSARADRPVRVKLDSNENPYGPSPRVLQALGDFSTYHHYPDPDQKELRRLIADYAGVDPDQLMVGSGSDELIDLLCRLYLEPGDEIIDCTPTFGMYRFSTELCGGTLIEAARREDWSVDLDAVRAALSSHTRMIFVATPNNPTGNLVSTETVHNLLELGPLVVLDEAYVEFSGEESWCQRAAQHERLVVLRTFSKWAGLAGLRVGYGVFPAATLQHLWKIKPPFNVNLAAEAAVRASLEDAALLRSRVECIVAERGRMAAGLTGIDGLRVWPSRANFLLVGTPSGQAAKLKAHLAQSDIAVRAYTHPRLCDTLRITVGRIEDTDSVVRSVEQWAEERSGLGGKLPREPEG